jgi:hypothetical protein
VKASEFLDFVFGGDLGLGCGESDEEGRGVVLLEVGRFEREQGEDEVEVLGEYFCTFFSPSPYGRGIDEDLGDVWALRADNFCVGESKSRCVKCDDGVRRVLLYVGAELVTKFSE